MNKYEYKSENVPGNLHEMTYAMNQPDNYLVKGGWELVTAQSSGRYTVAIFRREPQQARPQGTRRKHG